MVRLAACLGDSGAVEALIRLGLGREDRVLVFRCDFATPPTPPVRMVSFQGAPNSLNRSELRVRAAIHPFEPNFCAISFPAAPPKCRKTFRETLAEAYRAIPSDPERSLSGPERSRAGYGAP